MKIFYVYKIKYSCYTENRGMIIVARDWKKAKGIAMDKWKDQNRSNVEVEEIKVSEGIICDTDYILNTDKFN